MKKSILFSLSIIAFIHLNAQITINRNHIVTAGQIVVQSNDTNTIQVESGGTNKTWNFSGLKSITKDTIKFEPAQWYPGHTYFPDANIALVNSPDDSDYTYLNINNSQITFEGNYTIDPDTIEIAPFKRTILKFPSTFNSTFSESTFFASQTFPLGFDVDSTGPMPFIDSIRVSPELKTQSNIEGWGSITTPLGTYNALMQNVRNISTAKLEMFTSGLWITLPSNIADMLGFSGFTDTSYQHQFWTDDATIGFPIVTYSYNQGENTTSSIDWLQAKPKTNNLSGTDNVSFKPVYPNPANQSFIVSISDNKTAGLNIFDMNGKLVKCLVVENGYRVDISDFENGIYTIQYTDLSSGASFHSQKIIKF